MNVVNGAAMLTNAWRDSYREEKITEVSNTKKPRDGSVGGFGRAFQLKASSVWV